MRNKAATARQRSRAEKRRSRAEVKRVEGKHAEAEGRRAGAEMALYKMRRSAEGLRGFLRDLRQNAPRGHKVSFEVSTQVLWDLEF